jgi:hypothetical protein
MQSIIDARADARQRAALTAILQGEGAEPGMTMLQIYRSMCRVAHPPLFAPIELAIEVPGRSARLNVADLIETTVEPIRNPVTGAEHRARIDLPLGKEYQLAEVASGTTRATGAVPLSFSRRHAHLVYNALTSQGPAAPQRCVVARPAKSPATASTARASAKMLQAHTGLPGPRSPAAAAVGRLLEIRVERNPWDKTLSFFYMLKNRDWHVHRNPDGQISAQLSDLHRAVTARALSSTACCGTSIWIRISMQCSGFSASTGRDA